MAKRFQNVIRIISCFPVSFSSTLFTIISMTQASINATGNQSKWLNDSTPASNVWKINHIAIKCTAKQILQDIQNVHRKKALTETKYDKSKRQNCSKNRGAPSVWHSCLVHQDNDNKTDDRG